MSFVDPNDPLWREMDSLAEAEGLKLYDLERLPPKQLRVTIDRAAHSAASGEHAAGSQQAVEEKAAAPVRERVTSGDCSKLCRRLMAFFAVNGSDFGISAEPEIEVSSPGVNRNLRRPDHFAGAVGERVRIVSMRDYEGPESFPIVGTLLTAEGGFLHLAKEGTKAEAVLPLEGIKKAHVDFRFD